MTMKKLIALLLAVLMVAALAACGAEPPKTTEVLLNDIFHLVLSILIV